MPEPAAAPPTAEPDVWTAAVHEALAAVDRGAWPEAREAFARAEAARPGTPSVKDGLARLEAAEKNTALETLRRRGQEAEAQEDWRAALATYDSAQRIDPIVAFAVEGRARAVARQALDERLAAYLKRADRLTTEGVAAEAEGTLDRAAEVDPVGPRLRQQVADLKAALAAARTNVTVRLLSDGLTEVSILRVGPLGAFKDKSLDLRPGAYVVVGTRKGYRDTRKSLEVAVGARPELRVQCEEAL